MSRNIAASVIAKFGGLDKAHEAIGAPKSTIQGWRKAGHIPEWRRTQVVAAATRLGIELPAAYVNQKQRAA